MRTFILAAFLLSLAGMAQARAWRVEKDGSGDFTVIQQAVDASASGDTILIGAGRYDDKFLWGTPPWQQYTRVLVTRADLTLIGAGADRTIIGDAVPLDEFHDQDSAIAAHEAFGASVVSISNVGVENCYFGLRLTGLASAAIGSCRFTGSDVSIHSNTLDVLSVAGCDFESLTEIMSSGYHVLAHGPGEVVVADSEFAISTVHANSWGQLHLQGLSHADVHDCTFVGGKIAIYATLGSGTVEISRCSITDQFHAGIVHTMPNGMLKVSDTVMRLQYKALLTSTTHPNWEVDRLVVEDVREYSFGFLDLGDGHIRNSQLARGDRYVVTDNGAANKRQAVTFDMTNNWWGTANPDSIQAWIYDGHDQPARPYFIDWEPCRSVPVGAERRSLGSVKSLYR